MNGVLALRGVRVQGANAVAGLTYGFPAISGFLGCVEALDRRLRTGSSVDRLLDGCAIVCHSHHTLTDSHYGVRQFCLARRPLQPNGQTTPFVEEGLMHMTVTLLVAVDDEVFEDFADEAIAGDRPGVPDEEWFATLASNTLSKMRIAGGIVLDIDRVEYVRLSDEPDENRRQQRRLLLGSLPGFALVDRSELLPLHLEALRDRDPETSLVEAWMDFGGLRFRAEEEATGKSRWARVPLPETGWFVPIATGYRAIAPVQEAGSVAGARDPGVPFVPVESVYGVGQWLSPHRASDVAGLVWRHEHDGAGRYSFVNRFTDRSAQPEEQA